MVRLVLKLCNCFRRYVKPFQLKIFWVTTTENQNVELFPVLFSLFAFTKFAKDTWIGSDFKHFLPPMRTEISLKVLCQFGPNRNHGISTCTELYLSTVLLFSSWDVAGVIFIHGKFLGSGMYKLNPYTFWKEPSNQLCLLSEFHSMSDNNVDHRQFLIWDP